MKIVSHEIRKGIGFNNDDINECFEKSFRPTILGDKVDIDLDENTMLY